MIRCQLGLILAQRKFEGREPFTQIDVAQATGLNPNTISSWANDNVQRYDAPVLNALCRVLGVTPGDLLIYVPDEEEEV